MLGFHPKQRLRSDIALHSVQNYNIRPEPAPLNSLKGRQTSIIRHKFEPATQTKRGTGISSFYQFPTFTALFYSYQTSFISSIHSLLFPNFHFYFSCFSLTMTQPRVGRSSSVAAKRTMSSSENVALSKTTAAPPPKKRSPLANLTNHRPLRTSSSMVACGASKVAYSNKAVNAEPVRLSNSQHKILPPTVTPDASVDMDISSPPSPSSALYVSMDESMSTTDSMKSPDVQYLDDTDFNALNSVQRNTLSDLHITEQIAPSGNLCKRNIMSDIKCVDNVVGIDEDLEDPQLCATFACDIYKHLRASETKKRPSTDYMEKIQEDITPNMRSILIDWLVEVSEEYRLVPDTLYLTINYIDRYLSGNSINKQQLQLLGVACMMIAAKFEEICAPQVEEYCYITDNTYSKEEVLQMESRVLSFLKFEMSAPTIKCFLRRFVRAAKAYSKASQMQLECLSNYVAELALLEYHMLHYSPSIIAASATFLAKYILSPSERPWNTTLQHYTLYQPSQLQDCVQALHKLCLNNSLPAIREKYSQHKYKFVAKKYCPPTISPEYFSNASCK